MTFSERMERFSPAFGFLGFILVVVAGGWWGATGVFDRPVWIIGIIGIALLVYWGLGSVEEIRDALTGRSGRLGALTTVLIVAVVVIVGLLNFLSLRYNARYDVTANKAFQISDQTVKILEQLKEPVTVKAFFVAGDSRVAQFDDLMKEYTSRAPGRFTIDKIDPEQSPIEAQTLGIRASGTVVFQTPSGKKAEATTMGEAAFTGALIRINSDRAKKVYFASSNGERDTAASDQEGMAQAKRELERLGYVVESFNLLSAAAVPGDAAVLVMAGAKRPYTDEQGLLVERYLQNGGRVLLMVDPSLQTSQASLNVERLIGPWGLRLVPGVAADPQQSANRDPGTPLINRYNFHPITKELNGVYTAWPLAVGIAKLEGAPTTLTITMIAETGAESWAETDPSNLRFDAGPDTRGPLALAVAVERVRGLAQTDADKRAETGRLVVFGDSDIAGNRWFNANPTANGDFFLNSVNWLAEEESLISLAPKPPDESRRMILTGPQQAIILITSLLFLPLAVVVVGVVVWWQRR